MFWKHIARIVALLAVLCMPLLAQQVQQTPAQQAQQPPSQELPAHVTLQGTVRSADGTPIPGASVTIKDVTTGKQWITWTDETGKFRLPELPGGKFTVEAAQIGFMKDTQEIAPTAEKSPDIILNLRVASLDEIAKSNEAQAAGTTAAKATTNPPAASTSLPAGATTPPGTTPPAQGANNAPGNQTGKSGKQNQNAQQGARGGRNGGGFSQVNVGGQGALETTAGGDTGADQSALGQSASSDAMLMNGTTAQGDTSNINFFMGGAGGNQSGINNLPVQGLNQPGGQPGQDMSGGFPGGMPGGNPGGGFPGGRGGGGAGGGPGGGGRGGGGPGGGRGGRAGQGQNGVPWGMQQLIRRRINTMHYTLNETLNDSAFNAKPWSATGLDVPKPSFENNNFGGSIGGPLRIPKIYDGRDKTYFFINANFLTGTTGNTLYSLVPTAAERTGNFCGLTVTDPVTQAALPLQLYDYTSNFDGPRTPLANLPAGNCNLSGVNNPATGQPYVNPAAMAIMNQYIPQPNLTTPAVSPTGQFYNYFLQYTIPTNNQRINVRLNQTITKKWNLGVVYNISQAQTPGQGNFQVESSNVDSRGQNVTLTSNYNFSPRLIDSFTANFTRSTTVATNAFTNASVDPEGPSGLGINGVSTLPINYGLPTLNFNGGITGVNTTNGSLRSNQTWILTEQVTWIPSSKHELHFGYIFRRYQFNTIAPPEPNGAFTFTGALSENYEPVTVNGVTTEQPISSPAYAIADFLLGLPQSTNVQFGSAPNCGVTCASNDYLRSWGNVGYVTDNWHIRPSLTITYGLRYELMLPPTELFGDISNLQLNSTFTSATQVCPQNGVTIATCSPVSLNSLIKPDYKDLAPALAIAWRVPGKIFKGSHAMTFRAGYRIADNSQVYNSQLSTYLLNQAPYGTSFSLKDSATQILTLANGFPAQPAGILSNTYAVQPNYSNLYVQTWSAALESQIVDGFVWQVTYTGIKGTGLNLLSAPNSLSTTGTDTIPNVGGFTYVSSGASSIYHGVQGRLLRRMKNGFTFTALYTFSKSIDDSSSIGGGTGTVVQEFPLFSLERGLSTFNMKHQITGNSTYELPFGERKRWAKNGAEARAFGNFRLSGSVTYHTGMPFTALVQGALADFSGNAGSFSTRADLLPGCNVNDVNHTLGQWFNTACFAAPGSLFLGTDTTAPGSLFGDAGRDTIIGPSSEVVNMQLARSMQLNRDGQHTLTLRWEVTNLTNTANYSSFGTVVNTPSSFGKITGAAGMRTMDAVIRLNF